MQPARLARRLAVLPTFAPAVQPPLCPLCVQAVRSYGSTPHQPRPRKAPSEFSSRSRPSPVSGPSSSRAELSTTDATIRAQFFSLFPTSSSSTSSSTYVRSPDEVTRVLRVVYASIFRRELRSLADHHLVEISDLITRRLNGAEQSLLQSEDLTEHRIGDEEIRQITTVLGHCWTRAASVKDHLYTKDSIDQLGKNYADAVIRQALSSPPAATRSSDDSERKSKSLLDVFEASIQRYTRVTPELPAPMIAAWAVLRTRHGVTDSPTVPFGGPPRQDVQRYISDVSARVGNEAAEAEKERSLDSLEALKWTTGGEEMAVTPEWVRRELQRLKAKSDHVTLVDLWTKVRDYVLAPTAKPNPTNGRSTLNQPQRGSFAPVELEEVLCSFIGAFTRPSGHTDSTVHQQALADVMSHCPKPYSRALGQLLLSYWARPDGNALKAGHEVISLDDEVRSPTSTSTSTSIGEPLDVLKSIWKHCGNKDLKMYMIYLEGLGRFGDLAGLKETWNELVKDEECKKIYLSEEKLFTTPTFPPISALNQMISATLLIPIDGPPVALDLFQQASVPTSTIPLNLITINTVLRHYARQADLPSMSALFTLADKVGLKPDVVTYTTLVQGLLRAGRLELAKKVLEDMARQGISPNDRMCSMLIADLAKSGSKVGLEHAEELMKLMRRQRMAINEITWTGLIGGYFRGGWETDGWDAVRRMKRDGLKLNRVGWSMLLRQSAQGGGGKGVMRLWKKLLGEGVTPNSDAYLLTLTPLVSEKRWDDVDEVLREMNRRRFVPEKGALLSIVAKARSKR